MLNRDEEITAATVMRALEKGELEFWYQPKVSFLSGRLCGCEALIRWRRANGTVVSPAEFLPVVEEAGLNTALTLGMFPRLCADHEKLSASCGDLNVAFNVYAQDLFGDELAGQILQAVSTGTIKASQLQVELTESTIATGSAELERNVHLLVDAGIGLAMDDFGTGYSSLDTLRSLPFSVVKIDQGVVMDMMQSKPSAAIVHAGIRLAHELNVTSVAEGIESRDVYNVLQRGGCSEAQGFWISKPLPLDDFIAFARRGRVWGGASIGLLRHIEFDHIEWRRAVLDRVSESSAFAAQHADLAPSMSSRECRFGRWFHSEGRTLAERRLYEALEIPHEELHAAGARLLTAVAGGAAAEELGAQAAELNACSERLLRILQSFEVKLLLQESTPGVLPGTGRLSA